MKYTVVQREDQFYIGEHVVSIDSQGRPVEQVIVHGEGDWLRSTVEEQVARLNLRMANSAA